MESEVEKQYLIAKIVVYNRLSCCSNRINNTDIFIDGVLKGRIKSETDFSGPFEFNDNLGRGSDITLSKTIGVLSPGVLSLTEVQVFALFCDELSVPPAPDHGTITVNSDQEILFGCDFGYTLRGAGTVTCEEGGWSGPGPVCKSGQWISITYIIITSERVNLYHR